MRRIHTTDQNCPSRAKSPQLIVHRKFFEYINESHFIKIELFEIYTLYYAFKTPNFIRTLYKKITGHTIS